MPVYNIYLDRTNYHNPVIERNKDMDEEEFEGYVTGIYMFLGGDIDELKSKLSIEKRRQRIDLTSIVPPVIDENEHIIRHDDEVPDIEEDDFAIILGRRWYMPYAQKVSGEYGDFIIQYNSPDFYEGIKQAAIDLGIATSPRGGHIGWPHVKQ